MTQNFERFLFAVTVLLAAVHAQDQSGFFSIDCGSVNTSYVDTMTGIRYISDESFVEGGVSRSVAAKYQDQSLQQPLWNLRIFPQGTRNCYRVGIRKGNRYLIRATFFYGDYDEKGEVPEFDLYLGPNLWETVQFGNESTVLFKEIIHFTSSNFIHICLVNTGSGTPLISALELRKLVNNTYKTQSGSLQIYVRLNAGPKTDKIIRFPDDVLDRRWVPFHYEKWTGINTSLAVDSQGNLNYKPPPIVMSSAATPVNSNESLDISFDIGDPTAKFYVFMHFAEVQELQENQFRQFNISWNGEFWFGPVVPSHLITTTVFTRSDLNGGKHTFSIYKTQNSTLPPIINAVELYMVKEFLQSETKQDDVDAIMNIKSLYGLKRNWQGDPCGPQAYSWDGLNCSYSDSDPPRIIYLNLASCGLTGDIPAFLTDLTMLEQLDLSNNSLSGFVPDFLSKLPSLRVLNLSKNMLTGSVPEELIRKVEDGSLSLSVNENPNLCSSASCNKKTSLVIPLAASLAALFVLITALAIFWRLKKIKNGRKLDHKNNKTDLSLESKNLKFTYNEIVKITDNFKIVLGEGGFGKVYLGYLNNNEVAVKVLSLDSRQGYEQFEAEVKILLRVHHRNLTALVGYCYEDTNMGLIYEYMANGDLKEHLSGKKSNILSWEERLQIATEAAQGLEYLHHGCKPPMVHRDVKSTNILLDDKFHANLADLGLSRAFPTESGTHVYTAVAGTPGYLDPEYCQSNRLTEKSDVYSFGAVMLEIITSRPVIVKAVGNENNHLSDWVKSMLENGDIQSTVDPRLHGEFDTYSAWKAVEVAMACLCPTASRRPPMNHVVMELNECLEMERARKAGQPKSENSRDMVNVNLNFESAPLAR